MLVVQIDVDSRCRCHAVVQWSKFCYWCFVCFLSHRQIPSWSIHVHALSLATRFCRIVLSTNLPFNVTVLVVMWRRGGEDCGKISNKKYYESDLRFFHFDVQTKKIFLAQTRHDGQTVTQQTYLSIHCCIVVWQYQKSYF